MKTSLILSAHVVGLGVARALGESGLPVVLASYSGRDMGVASRFAGQMLRIPHPERQEHDFLKVLFEFGQQHPGTLLFPADDATLSTVSQHKEELSRFFNVACSDWPTVSRIVDKKYTYELARGLGLPKPRTFAPKSIHEAIAAAREIGFPCLIKPRHSHQYVEHLGKKAVLVHTPEELRAALQETEELGLKILVQEFIPGDDCSGVNYNSYAIEGEPCAEFTASKVRMAPCRLGIPRLVISRHIPEVLPLGRKLLKALRYTGYSCIEFKLDANTGLYRLLEINGRHNRSTLLSTRCGMNFPLLEYHHRLHATRPVPTTFTEGIYWVDEFMETRYLFEDKIPPWRYLQPYLKPHVCAVHDWRDLGPFVKRLGDLLARCLGQLLPFGQEPACVPIRLKYEK